MELKNQMGPVIIDFQSTQMSNQEIEQLQHPSVGGVILFARNFSCSDQLKSLTSDIKRIRPDCLICTDHEGGRVQRFKSHAFTPLPAMGKLKSNEQAFDCGVIMAYELKSHGVHLNFAPVLDKDGISTVIGDRAFADRTETIVERAQALLQGMTAMNLPSCGKHFPGHGSVEADSHIACPVDGRTMAEIDRDIRPFLTLINMKKLDAVMPAHVVYEQLDALPAGYSPFWLQSILKGQLGFDGVIFSDDLSMTGASLAGTFAERALAAYSAGCDFLLLCNSPDHIDEVLGAMEKVTLRPSPDCSAWFVPLPDNAEKYYQDARTRLLERKQHG